MPSFTGSDETWASPISRSTSLRHTCGLPHSALSEPPRGEAGSYDLQISWGGLIAMIQLFHRQNSGGMRSNFPLLSPHRHARIVSLPVFANSISRLVSRSISGQAQSG